MAKKRITGSKGGGGGGHTPTEQPNDLISVAKAKVLVALGEGEFAGGLTGQNIWLGGTPILNADGTENFPGIKWEFRPGTQAQTYIQGMPGSENEVSLSSTEIKSGTPWTKSFTNTQLSAVRLRIKWPGIFKQKDNGDLVGNTIHYAIDLQTDGGTWQTVLDTSVSGKTTSGYERSHRIDLPAAHTGWTVRLRKITEDASSAKTGDAMTLQSYTEVIDAKFRYPNTALLYLEFDSTLFNGSIPQISCEPRGRVIRVPDTYDPETRTYSGTWEGNFKWAWSNNPAWVFYDIVTSDRFGPGERLTAENIDIWTLYQVAQYCDQEVPDGKGGNGTHPRYLCDVYVQNRNDAFTVVRDFAAIFRGMTYWAGDQLVAMADMPRDVDYIYTRASVIDGRFTYASSTTKSRYSTALVSWSDPANHYADAMRPVFEPELVARYGVNQLEITAIGCTREAEADRKGRWGIQTNNKDRVVTFAVGLDGNIPQPGYVIAVADELLSGRVMGGRISSVNGRVLTLDRVPSAKVNDRLMVNLPSGIVQSRTIQSVAGNVVTVTTAFGETPAAECVWTVESDDLYAQQYRVTGITDNGDNTYSVVAVQHDPDKYARIDTGAVIDDRPVSVVPAGSQKPPASVAIDAFSMVDQGISYQILRATWEAVQGAIAYEAQWKRDDNNRVNVPRTSTTSFEVPGIYSGTYQVRVRAINAVEVSSAWAYAPEVTLTGKQGNPPVPVNFAAKPVSWGVDLSWDFGPDTRDTLKTEIQYGSSKTEDAMLLLADVPYPQSNYTQMGLRAGQEFYYRARLADRSGNESPWTEWVRGQTSADADGYLDIFRGKITETYLGQDLLKKMEQLGEGAARIEEIKKSWQDTEGRLNSQWSVRLEQMKNGQYCMAGFGVGLEEKPEGMQSQILMAADRVAFVNPADGNTVPALVIEHDQIYFRDALIRTLHAVSVTSSGNPPAFALTPEGELTARRADISGTIRAVSGELENVRIKDSCTIEGVLDAKQITGDIYNVQSGGVTLPKGAFSWSDKAGEHVLFRITGESFERVLDSNLTLTADGGRQRQRFTLSIRHYITSSVYQETVLASADTGNKGKGKGIHMKLSGIMLPAAGRAHFHALVVTVGNSKRGGFVICTAPPGEVPRFTVYRAGKVFVTGGAL